MPSKLREDEWLPVTFELAVRLVDVGIPVRMIGEGMLFSARPAAPLWFHAVLDVYRVFFFPALVMTPTAEAWFRALASHQATLAAAWCIGGKPALRAALSLLQLPALTPTREDRMVTKALPICTSCGRPYRQLRRDLPWEALQRHHQTVWCTARTVALLARQAGLTEARDWAQGLRNAGLQVLDLPTVGGGKVPGRQPWASAAAVDAARLMRGVYPRKVDQRHAWLRLLVADDQLRATAWAARRVGGARAVLALMRTSAASSGEPACSA